MVEVRETTRLVCPSDLRRPLPDAPPPAADAVIKSNPAGDRYLEGRFARGAAAEDIVMDARKACDQAGAK